MNDGKNGVDQTLQALQGVPLFCLHPFWTFAALPQTPRALICFLSFSQNHGVQPSYIVVFAIIKTYLKNTVTCTVLEFLFVRNRPISFFKVFKFIIKYLFFVKKTEEKSESRLSVLDRVHFNPIWRSQSWSERIVCRWALVWKLFFSFFKNFPFKFSYFRALNLKKCIIPADCGPRHDSRPRPGFLDAKTELRDKTLICKNHLFVY